MASEPAPPLGRPTFGPGWAVMTTPAFGPLPPLVGGAGGAPASRCAPRPVPLRPDPESVVPEPPPIEGGGGTTLVASCVPVGAPELPPVLETEGGGGTTWGAPRVCAVEDVDERFPEPPSEGAGATTLVPSDVPAAVRVPRALPPAALGLTDGGGATTFVASEVPALPLVLLARTAGGGGTTSEAPKILPTRLLMNDPLADCEGGGGTTVFDGSGMLPPARRCVSCETSAEGGGAMTAGAGILSRGLRVDARSGAETGGGITDGFVICTGVLDVSRFTPPGAGGITGPARAAVDLARSLAALGAGATTAALRDN
jgi:hypothetical protein